MLPTNVVFLENTTFVVLWFRRRGATMIAGAARCGDPIGGVS
jgi:hypothetical protein